MKKVLVADNDADTRMIYTTFLQHSGYEVIEAQDGSDAVELASEHVPALIVMNLSMPQLDGLKATSILRSDPRTAAIPIIACTGFVREDGEDAAEFAGCSAYLEKPCEPSRLLEEVARFIGAPTAPSVPAGG